MKKVALLFSAVVLFAGLTFGQTPQTQDKTAKQPVKKEATKDHPKGGCDQKTKEACSKSKDPKGCCAKDAKKPAPAPAPAPTTPEKK